MTVTSINHAGGDHRHQPAHSFLAAGTEGGDDPLVGEPGEDRLVGRDELARVHAQARQHAPGSQRTQRRFEGVLAAERLDRDIDAAALGETVSALRPTLQAFGLSVTVAPKRSAIVAPFRHRVDADDQGRSAQPGAKRGAQSNRALREDGDGVADLDGTAFSARDAGRRDVRKHQHLLVGEPIGNRSRGSRARRGRAGIRPRRR